ncbi:DUF4446 family protein [Paenibacillus piri]|uniref:DUF4446 family protein n=1 Tax=Paenibacillus piri TaxID=2547395 RepID=A0A4R5KIU6_9BACL|nr:DUF4446 family protein [Paenibacillus piri]TDF94357.1 DUF4446 family protein [Paenibacillus piri]
MGELLDLLDIRVLLIVLIAVMVLFFIVMMVLWGKLNRLRKTYLKMMNGDGALKVEDVLIDLQEKVAAAQGSSDEVMRQIEAVLKQMRKMKSNLSVYRYNAFAESGSDLSFSIVIADDEMDGVVLSGIHNRDETYVYAKPLTQGQSSYSLSPEEKEAIHRCEHKK